MNPTWFIGTLTAHTGTHSGPLFEIDYSFSASRPEREKLNNISKEKDMCYNAITVGELTPKQKHSLKNILSGLRIFPIKEDYKKLILQGKFIESIASGSNQFFDVNTEKIPLADGSILVITDKIGENDEEKEKILLNIIQKPDFFFYFLALVALDTNKDLSQINVSEKQEEINYTKI